jgi:protein TonB
MANKDVAPGSFAALESTLPPTPVKKLLSAGGAGVYVLSQDAALTDALAEAGGDQFPIEVVSTFAELRDLVEYAHCRIVLLDADLLGRNLRSQVSELRALEPTLVALIAAPREAAENLMGLLSERLVHRLLIKPAAVGITRLLLESAVGRYLQLRDELDAQAAMPITAPRRKPRPTPKSAWPAWLLAVAVVSLLVGAVVVGGVAPFEFWGGTGASDDAPSTAGFTAPVDGGEVPEDEVVGRVVSAESEDAPQPRELADPDPAESVQTPPAPAADPFRERLDRAAAALAEGRIASPGRDNAFDLYGEILAEQPDHPAAGRGLAAAVDAVFGEAEQALLAGDYDAAETALEHVKRVQPDSNRLRFLETQVTRERDLAAAATRSAEAAAAAAVAADLASAAPPAPEPEATPVASATPPPSQRAEPSELASLLAIAWTRLRQNQLLSPPGDSARDYVDRAIAIAPADPDALTIRVQVAEAVAESARLTLESGDLEGATQLADEAFRLGAASETLAMLDLDLAAGREAAARRAQADMLASGVTRMQQNRLIEPQDDSALFHLQRLRDENSSYPGLESAWRNLGVLLTRRADTAIAAGDWQSAEDLIAPLSIVADEATVARVRGELTAARLQVEYLATPAPPGELRPVSTGQVIYPADALRRGIEGWVDTEFILGADGIPHDVRTVGAEPAGWFEEAALASVSLYRYEPFERDGRVYERRARLRIRFNLR